MRYIRFLHDVCLVLYWIFLGPFFLYVSERKEIKEGEKEMKYGELAGP